MVIAGSVECRVIPNGVDLSTFYSGDRQALRSLLGIPQDARVLLSTAHTIRQNIWKDYRTLRAAIGRVTERLNADSILFIALGEDAPIERIAKAEVRFIPYQKTPAVVARYYQVADIYIHAARADTFPTTVLEALACGTPVVATAVGGIPEQVKGLTPSNRGLLVADLNKYDIAEATGTLVPPGDAEAMAESIMAILSNEELRMRLSENAAQDARERFDLQRQVGAYLEWYKTILESRKRRSSIPQPGCTQGGFYALSNPE